MISKVRCGIIAILLFGTLSAIAQTAGVSISPAAKQVRIDSPATMNVRIDNVQQLHGYSITVTYDTLLLRFAGARKSSFLSNTLFFVNVDSLSGQITLDEAILGSASKDGSGSLAEIDFLPRRVGSGLFNTIKADLRDPSNQVIPSTTAGGSIRITPLTGIRVSGIAPEEFKLDQNYPNPFNPSTTVTYQLATAAHVEIAVYSLSGQKVETLVDGFQSPGLHDVCWQGHNHMGAQVPSGAYFCFMRSRNQERCIRMSLLK
jgi:hypothetical protein